MKLTHTETMTPLELAKLARKCNQRGDEKGFIILGDEAFRRAHEESNRNRYLGADTEYAWENGRCQALGGSAGE